MPHFVYRLLALTGSLSPLGPDTRIARHCEALWVRMWGTHNGARKKKRENNQLYVQF